ncbi:iron compound ABC transporter, periplasmic substrate-binding protein [Caenispirillum salinarum AK4]|uniref:Iron compound ABC transporter, periplasmic substrate-binding protein n=1 Tax=Caenispirillum salinarum AK4 TaxID=1238182 RepID=K9GX11_9PROT|nr:ABC transporter substrate-binding protein [Caenispirillum salinarum]EKV29772.1 iron compound ABC transporter, periplasmic substrate-binding protein [Caenispirillum salinarum AK4]
MRAAAALLGVLGVAAVGPAAWAAERPLRVAAATVCADQYVLALADRVQIAALSPDAIDPTLSLMAEQAAGLPRLSPSAETYLDAGVDVLVTNAWSDHQTVAMVERFGVTVVRIPLVDSLDAVAEATTAVARALGQADRGRVLVAGLRQRMEAVAAAPNGAGRMGLYLRPGGGTAAAGSFVDTIMSKAGLRNKATEQGLAGWASTDLERFIADPPEVIVTSFFESPYPGSGRAFSSHPAFTRRAANLKRADVPGAMWVCSGWMLAEAAAHLNAELAR